MQQGWGSITMPTSNLKIPIWLIRGLETGDREVATHVMRNAEGVLFAFSTPYHAGKNEDMHAHHARHGDGVKDVAFSVENTRSIYDVIKLFLY